EALSSQRIRFIPAQLPKTEKPGTRLGVTDESESFRLLGPLGTVVLSDRPTFKWEPLEGAGVYTVFVRDLSSDTETESEPIGGTSWRPRESLGRGHAYSWVVEAMKSGRRILASSLKAPHAEFRVLEAEKVEDLAHAKKIGSRLVMALL